MQCCPLEEFMWWTSFCCYVPWLLLLSCYPLLHLDFLFFPINYGPFQPLTTHDLAFSLPSWSSILNLVYLCYFKSSIFDFWSFIIPLSLLSNAIGLTQFRFFKGELYPISHNALIMDYFNREKLYGVPRATVSSFCFETNSEKTIDYALFATFYIIPIWYSERELWRFSQGNFFEMNFKSLQKTLTSTDHISQNVAHLDLKYL